MASKTRAGGALVRLQPIGHLSGAFLMQAGAVIFKGKPE
jgi:hypothetical protein